MSKYRTAIRFLFIAVLALPLSAFAANYDVKALIDTDNSRGTGCPVVLPDGTTVTGIDTMLTTSVTVTGNTGTVTAVTRQTCVGGVFAGPVPVDNGWNVGVSPTGDLLIESHLGPNIVTMNNVGTPRFVFTTTTGTLFDTLLQPTTTGGGDIIMPQAARDRAVATRPLRTIVLNGDGSDWGGDVPLASGTDNHPALRFISVDAYAGSNDLYFKFLIHTNPAAPTAHDDVYDLPTLGGTLSVSTLGVLTNDNPNGQSISALLVDNPQHGTVNLNANGGFVYTNDGAHVAQDQFHYFANGNLPSNTATVTITMPGTKYVFTSADHVIFTAGVPSSFTVTVTGKPTPALSEDGALPAGITFVDNGDGTGTLSGTPGPSTVGTYPLVFHAEKNKPHQADQIFTLSVVCGGITVTNPVVNTGTVGTPFSQTFTQSGGAPPISWSETGALPPGLTLNPGTGVLSGTPTHGGTFTITVKATDANGCVGTGQPYTLTIVCNSITVTNPVVNTGTVNVPFSQTFTQAGGVGTTTFSLNSGTLPAGLTLNPATGVLSGTPTQTGSFPITVKATDSNGCSAVGPVYALTINCQVITVTNPATSTGTVNVAFSQTFTASNTIPPVTFSLNSGTLPAGLTLSSGGVLSGTPTQIGSFPITVKATDANGCTGIGATYTLVISCQTITVTNPATNTGIVNTAFSQTFTAGNTVGTVTFTLNSGVLPAGLTLSSGGVLSGTPTQTGSFPITVKATDANGCFGIGSTYTLTISCQTITVTNPATNSGTINAPFSQTFTAGNTIGAVTFTLNSGTLPTGLTLSTGGVLSGTPTQTGSFPITVKATDANGCFGIGATYNLTINCQVITVTNPATTTGTAGTAFSQTFTQSGGFGATTFAIFSGTLPTGMTFHSATGVLDGTPTQTGSFPLVIRATDSNGCTGNGSTYTLVIGCQTITVTYPATTTGTAGTAFSQTFTQSGGIGTTTFAIFSGTLPTGMTFHSATGVLDGTPTQTGSFPLVIRATDSNGCTGDGATYTLVIGCQTITVTNPATTTGTAGTPFSQTFTQSGAIGGATFSLNSGSLPAGLSLSSGGVLSGTPTQTGSFPITVKVTDGNSCTGVGATYTLVIGCQTITVTNPATTTGTIQVAFSQTFTQSGAIGGATFSLNSGSLPAGLTLSSGGVLSGTPTVTGSFPITVKVTDGNGCTGVGATYNLVINCQTITVTNPATTTGTVSTPFTQTFTQTGANGTATFTTASTLPAGLTLATNGTLSGTPTQPGTFPIVVTVTDSNGCTGTGATYTLIISCQTITVTNPATTSGPAGTPFSVTFTQSGGIGTTTFSETGALPTGLTFHTATGVLDGTPTQGGTFPITVTATDSNGCTGTGPTYSLNITCPTITVTNPGVSTGTVDAAFSQTFTQSGGNGTITWSKTGAIPAGMTFHTATGVLDGTPSAPGSFPITVTATDSNGCTGSGSPYTLVIACQTITVTNPGVTTGTVDAAFSQTFTQSGVGTHTPATFSLNSGSLPSGLSLSAAGVLSGTPGQPGSFPITVKVTDANNCTGVSATYTLVISCQTITVTKPVTTTGTVNAPFSQTFTQTGVGTHTPATFTLNSGSLPAGLSLSTAGVLSGTPTVPGSFPITVKVTDANGCFGVSTTYTLVIACQTITVTNPATTTGTVGVAFSQTFTQSGAQGTATFSTASTLPTGFTLSTAGVLSGTTNQHGSFPIVVTVTDSNGCTGTSSTYTLVINCQTITVTNPGVTTGTVGTPFGQTFTQTGGIGATNFTTASTLPTGLTLSTAGLLSGTPLQSGSFPIVVTATDSNGCTGTGPTYTLVIACNVINVTNPATSTGTVDAAFSQTFTQSGGNGTITWSKSGAIPAGMTFHTATGVLDGTPSVPGSFPITVTATDSNGCQGTGSTYTLVINCQTITVTNPATTTGTVDAAFNQTFTQSGVGTHTPATFSLNSGSLAGTGLTLSAAGVLSGTPTAPGSIVITVKVTDANGCTGIGPTYTLVIACQTITVTNPVTTSGTFNTAFSQTFTQSGVGTHTPANFTINSGTLPSGLTLSSAGVLSGTPGQTGTFPITVKVTDANGCFGIGATYNLAINPNVGNDAYGTVNALVDNTQAFVTGGSTATPGTPAVQLSGSVLANDLPAGGVSVTAGSFGTTAGGTVLIQTDGTFLYTPKANPGAAATTSDSFTYTGTSNTGATATPTSAVGTVNLTLLGRVWYVKNNGGGTNGQSQSPFTTLAAAAAASTANDIIFVYNGNGTNSGQNAGITLKSGQQLLGEINGLTVNTFALVSAGSRPTIGNSGGDGVTVPATAGSLTAVFIKGLSIAGTANGINFTASGTNTLTATVDNVVVTAATANNGIEYSGSGTGTTTLTMQNNTVNSAGQNGIDAQQTTAGVLVLNINNNNLTATNVGINVNGAGSTSTTITNFASNTVTGNTGGTGILIASATFDALPGTVAFDVVSGGNTVVGSAGNGVGTSGLVLNTVKGDLSFTDLDIVNSNGTGLLASAAAAFNSGTGTGFQITITGSGAGSVDATGGPAADLTTVTSNLPWGTIKSTNSSSTGVSLVTVPGTFTTSGATSSISNATSTDFNISGSNATVTYDGTITDTTGRAVAIASTTGGTKTFSGAITNNGGTGILLTSNTGATINFSGTIILSTGSGDAFTATGGGTVSASDVNSTLTTTTGVALNVTDTIGAANLKFKSITAGTAASGPSNGIVLNGTGASGGLIVIGTGATGGGGTIQKTTGSGISLTNVGGSASLTDMNITNTAGDGITAATVKNFSCSLCVITNPGTSANKDGIRLTEASGAASLTNVTVTGATTDGVNLTNTNTTLTSFTVTGGSLSSTNNAFASADSGLIVIAKGTGVITTATVSGVTFNANFSSAIQSFAQDTASIGDNTLSANGITVSGCTFTNNGAAAADFDAGTGSGNMKFRFLNNTTITNNIGPTVNVFSSATGTGGLIQGRIDGNQIGACSASCVSATLPPPNGIVDSGSTGGAGIRVFLQGVAGNITIANNIIRATACSRGIEVQTLGPVPANGGVRQSDIVITGNDVNNFSSDCSFPLNDIYLTSDNQAGGAGTTLRADVKNNKIKGAGATPGNTDIPFDNAEWLYFDHTAGTAQLVGSSGTANSVIAGQQTLGSAKANAAVSLIAGPITTVP
jgi:hypothetical protein